MSSVAEQGVLFGGGSVEAGTPGNLSGGNGSSPIPPLQLRVYPVAFANIRHLIVGYHYLKRAPAIPLLCFGVVDSVSGMLEGALVFGQPAARLEDNTGATLELRRFYLSGHCAPNSESRVLGYCIRWIRREQPDVVRLISYSDLGRNHRGIIYRATGWRKVHEITQGSGWDRPNRQRTDNPASGDTKIKWEYLICR